MQGMNLKLLYMQYLQLLILWSLDSNSLLLIDQLLYIIILKIFVYIILFDNTIIIISCPIPKRQEQFCRIRVIRQIPSNQWSSLDNISPRSTFRRII